MILPEHLSTEWRDEAICATTDPDLFHPDKGGPTKDALAICAECPVAAACLADALRFAKQIGIRGGMTARDRTRIRQTMVST